MSNPAEMCIPRGGCRANKTNCEATLGIGRKHPSGVIMVYAFMGEGWKSDIQYSALWRSIKGPLSNGSNSDGLRWKWNIPKMTWFRAESAGALFANSAPATTQQAKYIFHVECRYAMLAEYFLMEFGWISMCTLMNFMYGFTEAVCYYLPCSPSRATGPMSSFLHFYLWSTQLQSLLQQTILGGSFIRAMISCPVCD